MQIRALDPVADRADVAALLTKAQDYYLLWKGYPPGAEEVDDVFIGGPPGCDPAQSHRLGLYLDDPLAGLQLSGVAELSFGFPEPQDAYLGLMILAPSARSGGHGAAFLAHVEGLARARAARTLYLAVLEKNTRGHAFWTRMGFGPTGVSRDSTENGLSHRIHRLKKPL
ncbi:GNAT family N-acetyltransferase [Pseudotabrizicola sp. L79]|uniref:GNAT family N-acetyltransferase n=1 Tax=Pseudotabrizicola sp. L79 TaxID=3118402 RepID=UPI002F954E60